MARQPGSTSGITVLITGIMSLLMIAILISGHLGMAMVAYSMFTTDNDLNRMFTDMTALPIWALWFTITGALIMDAWIIFHMQKDKQERLKR